MHTKTDIEIPFLSLDELEERIEKLISLKLSKLAENKLKYFNFKNNTPD